MKSGGVLSLILRDYQELDLGGIRVRFGVGDKRVLYVCSTGGGKTVVFTAMVAGAFRRGRRVLVAAHRDYLISQIGATLEKFGLEYGVIAAGYDERVDLPVQIGSTMSLLRRLHKYEPFDLVVFDEAHRSMSATNREIIDALPNAHVVGVTATPARLDGKPLGEIYQSMVVGPPMRELIARGYLVPFRYFAPSNIDLSGIRSRGGDYAMDEVETRVAKPSITGDVIEHYRRLAPGKRAIVFCVSREHSRQVARQFTEAGIPARHIDGETPRDERARIRTEFDLGRIQVLTNVELVSEGYDIPAVEAVIQLRPTQSLVLFLQMVGRALRTSPGKLEAVLIDHVGNCFRHGLPDEDREWSLTAKLSPRRGSADAPNLVVTQCKNCFRVYRSGGPCPHCGTVNAEKKPPIKLTKGELEEIKKVERRNRVFEEFSCRSLAELQVVGKNRGHAPGWAMIRWPFIERARAMKKKKGNL
jgi:DNA repair protein RadD